MKRFTTIFLLLSLLFAVPCGLFAQVPEGQEEQTEQAEEDHTLEQNLNALQSDLTKLSAELQTFEDIETCDYAFQEAGNRLRAFAAIVSKDSPLYETYDNCNQMYYQLQKLIDGLREDHSHKQDYDALMNRLQAAITDLSTLKEQGEHFVAENDNDSLIIIKKKATKVYAKAEAESEAKKQLLDADPELQQLMDAVDDSNESIQSLQCRDRSRLYEMGFRIIMVVLAVLMVINMLRSKLKAKKMTKEAQKQMNQFMGGDETPTL